MTDKFKDAVDLMMTSVYKPDYQLRLEAKELSCLPELIEVREQVINFLQVLRTTPLDTVSEVDID